MMQFKQPQSGFCLFGVSNFFVENVWRECDTDIEFQMLKKYESWN